jgi:hypothetical protein
VAFPTSKAGPFQLRRENDRVGGKEGGGGGRVGEGHVAFNVPPTFTGAEEGREEGEVI